MAIPTIDHTLADSSKRLVNDAWHGPKVLVVDLLNGSSICLADLTIELLYVFRCLLVLELADNVHEELVAIVHHCRRECPSDLVFETGGV